MEVQPSPVCTTVVSHTLHKDILEMEMMSGCFFAKTKKPHYVHTVAVMVLKVS